MVKITPGNAFPAHIAIAVAFVREVGLKLSLGYS